MKRRQLASLPIVLISFMAAAPVFGDVIYNSIPVPQPASLVSQSFQANRDSEFGDLISFDGTARNLTSATVAMVTWGYFSKYNAADATLTDGWTEPAITLDIFSVDNSGANPAPGSLLGSVTESALVPWRPEPTASCGGTLWLASDGCHNGYAFDITFDFTSLGIVLPNQIIYGIAYNTQSGGQTPLGVNGPYNDLNVGLSNTVTAGSNPNAPTAYLSGTIGAAYADNGAAGINVFRQDAGGTHTDGAIQFDAASPTPEPGTIGLILAGGLLLLVTSIRHRKRTQHRNS